MKGPELFDQAIVQLPGPLPGEKLNDRLAAREKLGTIPPDVIDGVCRFTMTLPTLRVRFALDPIETIADLNFRGFEVTPDEIDVFIRTDTRTWFWSGELLGDRVH